MVKNGINGNQTNNIIRLINNQARVILERARFKQFGCNGFTLLIFVAPTGAQGPQKRVQKRA